MDGSGDFKVAVIIDDSPDISGLLETVLTSAGFRVIVTDNGFDGVQAVRAHSPVITTLDVNMPGIDGFETARRIRYFSNTYLIMLTARDDEIDTLQGLEAGADDYLTKPFRPRELRARIAAMQRRPRAMYSPGETPAEAPGASFASAGRLAAEPGEHTDSGYSAEEGWVMHNGLAINEAMRLVEKDGNVVDLTRSEFSLLAAIVSSGRRVRSKTDLALLLRGDSEQAAAYVSESDKRAIEVHMANLRRKLGDSLATPRFIETVRGIGYRVAAAEPR